MPSVISAYAVTTLNACLVTSTAHADDEPTARVWKRRDAECDNNSAQERSRTRGGVGPREQFATCPSAGTGARGQVVETGLQRGRCGGSGVGGESPEPHHRELPQDSLYHVSLGVPLFQQSLGILKHRKRKSVGFSNK